MTVGRVIKSWIYGTRRGVQRGKAILNVEVIMEANADTLQERVNRDLAWQHGCGLRIYKGYTDNTEHVTDSPVTIKTAKKLVK